MSNVKNQDAYGGALKRLLDDSNAPDVRFQVRGSSDDAKIINMLRITLGLPNANETIRRVIREYAWLKLSMQSKDGSSDV